MNLISYILPGRIQPIRVRSGDLRGQGRGRWTVELRGEKDEIFHRSTNNKQPTKSTNDNSFFKFESYVKGGKRGDGYKAKVRYRHF